MSGNDSDETSVPESRHVEAVVVGAGFSGIYMLHKLRELGFTCRLFEAAEDAGGVWWWNRYPGARCDVESTDYSYSFDPELEQEWHWDELYCTQPDILRYIHHVLDRYDLRPDMQFSTRVDRAVFDEATSRWTLRTSTGETWTTGYFILATGCLSVPKRPEIPGLDAFVGESYHTAEWPADGVDFTGKRVGMIGVGSSGTQMIPIVAEEADQLAVLQRSPNFSIPSPNGPMTPEYEAEVKRTYRERRAFASNTPSGLNQDVNRVSALEVTPEERQAHYEQYWRTSGFGFTLAYGDLLLNREANQTAVDFIASKIRETVKDPATAETLIPKDYPYGTKRASVDNGYYQTFNRPNVELVDIGSDPIAAVEAHGIRLDSGRTVPLDMIVLATGFDALTGAISKIDIVGRDGLRLLDKWDAGPRTYLGLSSHGFPNMFIIAGPGSPSVLTNVMASLEQHVGWLSELFTYAREHGIGEIEASLEAEDAWVDHVNELSAVTLYPQANSWYMGANVPGKPRVFMPYPGGLRAYRRRCAAVAQEGYEGFELSSATEHGSTP